MERADAELVEAACRGDLAAFRALYERHYRMAVGVARARLSDAHLAEDAAQEAFAVACRRLDSLRTPQRFPEWLGTICRRTATRMARSRRTQAALVRLRVAVPQAAASPHDGEADPADRVRAAIDRLPAAAREVVLLRYFSGLSHEEIARALGTTPQSVHGRLQRARRALARELNDDGAAP